VLAFAAFMFVTSEILPFGLITLMASDLARSEAQIGLLVTAYAAVVVAMSVPLAHFTRTIPRRWLLSATVLVYVAGMLLASLGGGFAGLLAGRMLTALAQAQFWAVVTATAAGLFPPQVRGKIVARLLVGPAAAGVFGLPSATWLGQHYGWRVPFFVLAGMAVAVAVAIALLVPRYRPAHGSAARGVSPSMRRYLFNLAITVVAVLGNNAMFTYVTPYLHDVAGFAADTIPVLLMITGIAGLASMILIGRFLDRFPMGTMAVGVGLLITGWLGVALAGSQQAVVLGFFCVAGFGLSVVVGAFANRALQTSPGNTDIAVATHGSFYNTGILLGSLLGSRILDEQGPRILPFVAAGFLTLALILVGLERRVRD
jgi:predicted MFS family arabinose efflux permease